MSTDGQTTASSALHKSQSDCDLRHPSLFIFFRQLTLVKQNLSGSKDISTPNQQPTYVQSGAESVSADGQTTASFALHKSQSDCDLRHPSLFFFFRQLTLVKQNLSGSEV